MIERLDTRHLRFGMHVVELDRPWKGTRFLYQRFTIETQEVLDELRRVSDHVFIETDSRLFPKPSKRPNGPLLAAEPKSTIRPALSEHILSGRPIETRWHSEITTLEEEISGAEVVESRAREVLYDTLDDIRMGNSVRVAGTKEVVAEMAESVIRNPDAMVVLSQLKNADEYTALHSLRVCILALTFGRHLDLSREELNLLGVGALLHDVGKMKVPNDILNKPGRLTDNEFEIMKSHVPEGVKILGNAQGIPQQSIEVAAYHHERYGGKGYAGGLSGDKIGLFGMISGIVDCYDAITSDRVYHAGMSPYEALTKMYTWRHTDFHPGLIEQFIQCMGIYPVGSVVELSDGRVGVVVAVNLRRRLKPRIAMVLDSNKKPLEKTMIVSLADPEAGLDSEVADIVHVLQPGDYGIDPTQYLPISPV